MKPALQDIVTLCPDVDPQLIGHHLDRLPDSYFDLFTLRDTVAHVRGLAKVSRENPVELIVVHRDDQHVDVTVLAKDFPFVFSLIAGLMAGTGLSIISGDIFTYEKAPSSTVKPAWRRLGRPPRRAKADPLRPRRIIDHFVGRLAPGVEFAPWSDTFATELGRIMGLLATDDPDDATRAKSLVNEMVTQRLTDAHADRAIDDVFLPVDVDLQAIGDVCNSLTIRGQDTPAFLYTLSTALSLQGLSIEYIRIRSVGQLVEDELHFVDAAGKAINDRAALDRVKFSVLLTKQFTYCLDTAPDRYKALTRFEQIVTDLATMSDRGSGVATTLQDPRTLAHLAKLLGASDYLWEDFIRAQYESILPLLTPAVAGQTAAPTSETLRHRLTEALEGATSFEQKRDQLNAFKDQQLFQIDLDHILTPDADVRHMSQRLTALADHLITVSAGIVFDHLQPTYGRPALTDRSACPWAVFGLGKLGGGALGHASDIELLFVYRGDGQTDGPKRLTNAEFFTHFVREITHFIQAKREGIFQIDLRLRPHGTDGPLAATLDKFKQYYSRTGPAHAVEQLALVRLRAIAGDHDFAAEVQALRDQVIFDDPHLVVEDIWQQRRLQYAQKVKPGQLNAKYSCGAMVDLEYTVQLLQVQYAARLPGLKTPSIYEALEELRDASILGGNEADRLIEAYYYFRNLTNALRMLRGSSQDLCLPPTDSDQLVHLARRSGYRRRGWMSAGRQLLIDFRRHGGAVRDFVERHFARQSLPDPAGDGAADVILSKQLTDDQHRRQIEPFGFSDTAATVQHLHALADHASDRYLFANLAAMVCESLRYEPHRDLALPHWRQLVANVKDPDRHYRQLLESPRLAELLMHILAESDRLAARLTESPQLIDRLAAENTFQMDVTLEQIEAALANP